MCLKGILLLLALSLVEPAGAQIKTLETEDLRLLYLDPSESYLAPYVARCFENAFAFHRRLFQYQPSEPVTVFLNDFGDVGNAGASSVPRNQLSVRIAPLSFSYETMAGSERMSTLMSHELAHIVTTDQAAGRDRRFRRLFQGKVSPIPEDPESIVYSYLTNPRFAAPRWFLEGIAVFLDTWMSGGFGRAQGGYDEMVFRSMIRDGSHFYDPLGLVSEGTKVDFQVEGNAYLYGTRFMTYLADRYTPESLIRWTSRGDGSKAYYSAQFRRVFSIGLEQAWSEWVQHEREFQGTNLEAIRGYPTTPYHDLSKRSLGAVSRAFLDQETGRVYAALNYPGALAHIGAISIEDGSVEKICDVKGPTIFGVTSLAWDAGTRTIYYVTDNGAFRDLMAVDPAIGRPRMLLRDARIGDLALDRSDHALWGVRHFNGIATLVRVPPPYRQWEQVHSWPYGEVIYSLDVSPDGQYLAASVAEIDGHHRLRVFSTHDLLEGEVNPVREVDFGTSVPSDFVFSPDGKYLYGSSYYTGVSNVFRFELATGEREAVSNCETGFFRPIPLGGDRLIVFRFTGQGFIPAEIEAHPIQDVNPITFFAQQVVERHPELKDWGVGSPAKVQLESRITGEGSYSAIRSIRLESLYPVVEGYKDFAAVGLRLNLSDFLPMHTASLTASYTPDPDLDAGERLHLRARYQRYDWKVNFKLNAADFYDLFGPTKASRKGWSLGVGYSKTLIYDRPRELRLSVSADYHAGLERLPDYQNVATSFDRLFKSRAHLGFNNVRSSLGAVDDEKGYAWGITIDNDLVNGQAFPKLGGDFDVGFPLPLGHSSIWLRSSAGYSPRDRAQPFANFYFGGFGNNWVDRGSAKRYRESYSFPGVGLNELGGTSYVRTLVEWNLPPVRFERLGTPGFYATWARPALFVGSLATDLGDGAVRRAVHDVGTQVDLRFTLLSWLDMTLSAGYAVAFENGASRRDEFMLSLKVLQ